MIVIFVIFRFCSLHSFIERKESGILGYDRLCNAKNWLLRIRKKSYRTKNAIIEVVEKFVTRKNLHNAHRKFLFVPTWSSGFGVSLTNMHLIYFIF
jgi:hypothetical protein